MSFEHGRNRKLVERFYRRLWRATTPIPLRPGSLRREDYEYARNGIANLFMVIEPLAGTGQVAVTVRCIN